MRDDLRLLVKVFGSVRYNVETGEIEVEVPEVVPDEERCKAVFKDHRCDLREATRPHFHHAFGFGAWDIS